MYCLRQGAPPRTMQERQEGQEGRERSQPPSVPSWSGAHDVTKDRAAPADHHREEVHKYNFAFELQRTTDMAEGRVCWRHRASGAPQQGDEGTVASRTAANLRTVMLA